MSDSFKKQLPFNLITNATYFGLNVLVGVWLVPYFIRHLGTEGYGFIPLATSITAFVSLITISLNTSVSRYLIIDLQKKDTIGANKTFNTAFWSIGLLSAFLVPLLAIFAYFVPKIFNVPPQISSDVRWLFFIISVSFIISVFSSIFSVATFVHNRLDLRNLIDIGNLSARTVSIVLLFVLLSASLISVGVAYFIGALVALGVSYFLYKQLTPELNIVRKDFDRSKFKELTGMGGWLVVNQVGSLLFLQIDLILVNLLFGAEQAGQYGAVIQWSFLLRSLAGVISGVFAPMVFISYAREQKDRIVMISQKAVKFLGLGMALLIGLLCGFARPILTAWLGQEYSKFEPLFWLLTGHLVINLAVLPLFAINTALGKVRIPGLVTLIMGIANVILAVFFAKFLAWGIYGVAAAGAVVLTLKNAFFTPMYVEYILKIPYATIIRSIGRGILLAVCGVLVGQVLNRVFVINSWGQLFLPAVIGFLFCLVVAICLLGSDRYFILSFLRKQNRVGH